MQSVEVREIPSQTLQLSSEDLLRLNVLLANDVEAIRIDEQSMTVCGLSGNGEVKIPLNPNCRREQYLRRVREALSSHVLGSPGGYPVFLQRWTRMRQAKDDRLERLLLLGEPEAVVAVAGAPGLTDDLARRAWWALPTAENARRMLQSEAVVKGGMGKVLADFLIEHLPFEIEPINAVTTVRLVLQPGLISAEMRGRIWAKGAHHNTYRLGFLEATPNDLPQISPARSEHAVYAEPLAMLTAQGNALAAFFAELLDGPGQSFLAVSESLLRHPVSQDTTAALLNAVGGYFKAFRYGVAPSRDIVGLLAHAWRLLAEGPPDVMELVQTLPDLRGEIRAMLALGHTSEELIVPILAKTTATGTLLRRKLEPVTAPLLEQYAILRGKREP